MRDVLDRSASRWWDAGETGGVGTVVGTWRSAPRPAGASMLVGPDGTAVGSVSGGCVEGAVYELASEVRDGRSRSLQRYGVSDDDAFAVGLTCGGIIDMFVEQVVPASLPRARRGGRAIQAGRAGRASPPWSSDAGPTGVGRRLVVWPDRPVRARSARARLDDAVDATTPRGLLAAGRDRRCCATGRTASGRGDGHRGVRRQLRARAPRMLVFGAIDFAAAVARVGRVPRLPGDRLRRPAGVRDAPRFPDADEVVVDWPHRYLQAEVEAGRGRRAHGDLRADPRPEVRRAAAGGRAAAAGGLRRRDGLPPDPRRPAGAARARPA